MNFFKVKTIWSNAEFIPLKLCIDSAYILIGSYFHCFFSSYTFIILAVFTVTVTWSVYLWIKKMRIANKAEKN